MRLDPPVDFRGILRADAHARAVYSEAAGIGQVMPRAVAVPQDAADVSALVVWAGERGLPLVPRGSGSSMAGGAIGEGVIVDLSRLRGLGEPDPSSRSIRAETGVLRGELDRRAATVGLRFPVDPSSGEFCTIGGMASTNAAGPRSLLHGPTRPWVLALDCVFADGSVAQVRRGAPLPDVPAIRRFLSIVDPALRQHAAVPSHSGVLKDSSGYALSAYAQSRDLVDLLVGSEGTLCLFTGVTIALAPITPSRATLLASFERLEDAVAAAVQARGRGASACELLDRTFLRLAAAAGTPLPVAANSEAVLLTEVEAQEAPDAAAAAEALRLMFRQEQAVDVSVGDAGASEERLWAFRHSASPAIARMNAELRSMQFIEDAAVPPSELARYVRGVRNILDRAKTNGVIFGHAGDAHVHVNPLINVGTSDWRSTVERILREVTDLVAALGGTLSGEHGDGRLRTPLLDRVWSPEERRCFALIKESFDPANLFNPGVKVPLDGQRALGIIKYDPTLAGLPPSARGALAAVEHARAYSKFRLDL